MAAPSHLALLQEMGLMVWKPRAPKGLPESRPMPTTGQAPLSAKSLRAPGVEIRPSPQADCIAIIQWPSEYRVTNQTPEGAMLWNILAALKAPRGCFSVRHVRDALASEISWTRRWRVVLIFAEWREAPDASSLGSGVVTLPTLEQMLADPGKKRQAWEQLKPLVGTL